MPPIAAIAMARIPETRRAVIIWIMTYGAYPARRAVAERVRECFARHLELAALGPVHAAAPLPDTDAIEALIDTAFWTSLRREEGYVPVISIAFLSADAPPSALLLERQLAFSPAVLAKVARAVERPGIHLGVAVRDGSLSVWGATRHLPAYCLVLEVAGPGLLVVKQYRGGDHTKFANI